MSTTRTQDLLIVRYGTGDGHQDVAQPLTTVSIYVGTVAVTRSGFLVNPDTSVLTTDTVWGVINGQVGGAPNTTTPLVGSTTSTLVCGISTGTFFLASGTGGNALTQTNIGQTVYLSDGYTVNATNNNNQWPVAGTLVVVDSTQPGGFGVRLGSGQAAGSP